MIGSGLAAIAGVAAADPLATHEVATLDAMAVPGLGVAARSDGLLAQGGARIFRAPGKPVAIVDGELERASAEVSPGRVVLRRDALGVRPLYYGCSADRRRIAWASRPTQLLACDWVDQSVDWEGLAQRLTAQDVEPQRTCIAGIRQVPAGHRIEWRSGEVREVQEWNPARFLWSGARSPNHPEREFACLLEEAVARRLDDGTTIELSGGLDSPTVLAAARRRGLRPRAITWALEAFPTVDERGRVAALLEAFAIDGLLVDPPLPSFDPDGELEIHAEPNSLVNHAYLRAVFIEAKVRGHDRLADGYDGDRVLGTATGLGPLILRRPRLAYDMLSFRHRHGMARRDTLWWWVGDCLPRVRGLRRRSTRRRPDEPLAWVASELLTRMEEPVLPSGDRWRETQVKGIGPGLALGITQLDRLAASVGVSLVHPLADQELVEFLLSLPPEAKYAGGRFKGLVRDGFPELPPIVRDQGTRTSFEEVTLAAHPKQRLAALVLDAPVPVPGIDYTRLQARLASEVPLTYDEVALLRRLGLAHRFLARHR